MKTLIYRIEDDTKQGFFTSDKLTYKQVRQFVKMNCPQHDIGINRNIKEGIEKCGFLNEKQLYRFIHYNDIKMLEKHGFKLKRFYAEVTAIGEQQVLFKI